MSDRPPFPDPEECWHDSATGVDQTDPRHPDKVWLCDTCGWLYRTVPVPDCPGVMRMVDAVHVLDPADCTICNARPPVSDPTCPRCSGGRP